MIGEMRPEWRWPVNVEDLQIIDALRQMRNAMGKLEPQPMRAVSLSPSGTPADG